jgi:hypothetical protein
MVSKCMGAKATSDQEIISTRVVDALKPWGLEAYLAKM